MGSTHAQSDGVLYRTYAELKAAQISGTYNANKALLQPSLERLRSDSNSSVGSRSGLDKVGTVASGSNAQPISGKKGGVAGSRATRSANKPPVVIPPRPKQPPNKRKKAAGETNDDAAEDNDEDSEMNEEDEVVPNDIAGLFKAMTSNFGKLHARLDQTQDKYDVLQSNVDYIGAGVDQLSESVSRHDEELSALRSEVKGLRRAHSDLKIAQRDHDQYGRRWNCEIRGLQYKKGDEVNCAATITRVFQAVGERGKVEELLDSFHYMGLNQQGEKKYTPYIICRFSNRDRRDAFVKAGRKAKLKWSSINITGQGAENPIYIGDNLNREFGALISATRKLAKPKGYAHVWFGRECVLVKKDDDSNTIRIHVDEDLSKIK